MEYFRPTYTPERITNLRANEIFVFGSNLQGMHGGGAARMAYEKFGAIWGNGVGLLCHTDHARWRGNHSPLCG